MGFFSDRFRPSPAAEAADGYVELDAAGLPLRRVLPGLSAHRVIVFHTADAVLVIDRFEVYRHGVGFRLNLQLREPTRSPDELWLHDFYSVPATTLPDDFLRLGVVFSDGSTWSNVELPTESEALGLTVQFLDGSASSADCTTNALITPMPPDGPLTFIAEWPAHGIAETHATVDAFQLRRLVDDVIELWPTGDTEKS